MIKDFLSSLFKFSYQIAFYRKGKVTVWVSGRDSIKPVIDIMQRYGYKFVGTKQLRGEKFVVTFVGDVNE